MKLKPLYPAFLDLSGLPVLVVGGGTVAGRKAVVLLESRARVTVVSPQFSRDFFVALDGARCRRIQRPFRPSDLKGVRLVFAATDDLPLNRRIARLARRQGTFVNVAAPPESGDLQVPAAVRQGNFCIAVSTGGASAALAAACCRRLGRRIGPEWGQLTALMAVQRKKILAQVRDPAQRRVLLQRLADPRFATLIKTRGIGYVSRKMTQMVMAAQRRGKL